VLLCRDGRVRTLLLRADPPAVVRWRLEPLANPEPAVLERRQRWMELRP
jgi:hypothetical protein